jgi:hypothetical protein
LFTLLFGRNETDIHEVFSCIREFSGMRTLAITSILAIGLAGCVSAKPPAISLSSAGAGPDRGDFRFVSEGVGEQPGDFLVRSQVERQLTAKGFRRVDEQPRYLVEIAVTSRPLNVGAFAGPAAPDPAWLDAPVAKAAGVGADHVCAVSIRFIDAGNGAEAYSVRALQHAPAPDCNTENFRLVDAALAEIPLRR